MTAIPRWRAAAPPVEAVADHRVALPKNLLGRVAALARRLGVERGDLLLTAHLAVIAMLASETDIATGHGTGVLTARLPNGSWLELIATARAAAASVAPGIADTSFSTSGQAVPADTLSVVFTDSATTLLLRYRADAIDDDYAGRVAGYLVRAIELMVADPDARWSEADLLADREREELVRGPGTRPRELPPSRFAELFAAAARRTPDAVALISRDCAWSYERLDRAANRVAHALLRHGVASEEVVAVIVERGPEWAAALIGTLRAGAAYLPIEPSSPAARVAEQLAASGCRIAVTGRGVPLGDVTPLAVSEVLAGDGPDHHPDVGVPETGLAYVFFTSGSTGRPKGAMCEHLGMVNHLYGKIDDLGLGPSDVVVQNAQSSFDISVWQLAAPLVVGARVLVVDRATTLDAGGFVDTILVGGATILQVVPSYLEVLLRHLEARPRDLGRLRMVSVTGEAVSRALVSRWLAAYPDIPLVNAYGATEASDDTTHQILTEPPAGDLVPVGRPIGNVSVRILGSRGELVPLGSIGEIVFSGICVGRGYLNDPDRTREAFRDDPYRSGARMYHTGDFGRWLPSGSIEFHGRRDEQVKVRGVRIEIGEVESRLRVHPQVREASVVVLPDRGSGRQLVGFYTGDAAPHPAELLPFAAAHLPEAAVPARLHRVRTLPLTENGKVDKKALIRDAEAATRKALDIALQPLVTPTERRIAGAWAAALDRPVDTIGRDAHFFDLGGTSLSALRAIVSLDGLITVDNLLRTPVLSALAAAVDGGFGGSDRLLRLLAGPAGGPEGNFVCLPYAAGTALNFKPLATALARREPGLAVYGLQPPGHDLGQRHERRLELDEVAKLLVDEIRADLAGPVRLWGHCTGAPLALDVARRLAAIGSEVAGVLVAGCLLPDPAELAREVAVVTASSDDQLGAGLAAQGGLDSLTEPDLAFVGRAYRHDVRTANQYLLNAGELWGEARLTCPVTVVVSTTDPLTADYHDRYRDWCRFADRVELAEIDGGGHYFPRTRPDETAETVLGARCQ